MTKPITTPAAAPTQGMNVAAAARATVAKAPNNFVELSGADLQALLNFQKTLPSSKGRKLIKTDDEEFATGEGTVTDSPEWVMAQANTGVVEVLVESGAGGAAGGAGGAAGGAAGAAGAGAAGAAAAPMVMSPLAFLPAALVLPNGSDVNNRPTLTRAPGKLTLDVNAAGNTPTSDPEWKAADPDNHTVFYFFQLEKGVVINDPEVFNLDGHAFNLDGKRLSAISEDGRFRINPYTGEISRVDSNDESEPVVFCKDEHLQVVVTDTALVSLPVEVVIDRTLPDFDSDLGGNDTDYSVNTLLNHSNLHLDNSSTVDDENSIITIDESLTRDAKTRDYAENGDIIRQIDKLNLDMSWSDNEINGLDFHRDITPATEDDILLCTELINLHAHIASDVDGDVQITVIDQFGSNETKVEYVQFAAGMTFNGYVLNDDLEAVSNESGYYHLATDFTTTQGALTGTECRDLLASDDGVGEVLDGLGGNDLIFSHGLGDTLIGGAGSDLLVIGEHVDSDDTVVATVVLGDLDSAPIETDHFDTVVNFDHHSLINVGDFIISFDAEDHAGNAIAKIDLADLDAYLATQEDAFYLITTNGDDADIWHFQVNGNEITQDQVAHFVDFDFNHYNVTPVIPA